MGGLKLEEQARLTRKVLWLILFLNLGVAGAKILWGLLSGSASLTADGFHSLSDGTSNIIALITLAIASRPPDPSHPYGHGKFEAFATGAIGLMLLSIAAGVGRSAWERWQAPVEVQVTAVSFAVLLITFVVNLWVATYEARKAKELGSGILLADSHHTRSDLFVTLSVFGSLVATRAGYPWVDTLVAGGVALAIGWAGLQVLLQTVESLTDRSVLEPAEVARVAMGFDGVLDCHNVRSRLVGSTVHVDLHLVVPADLPVGEAHALGHRVEDQVRDRFQNVREVVVHIEPAENSGGS